MDEPSTFLNWKNSNHKNVNLTKNQLSVSCDPNPTHHQLIQLPSLNNYQILLEKKKKARIKCATLQKNTHQGLDAPNCHAYYLANQLLYIYKWTHPNKNKITHGLILNKKHAGKSDHLTIPQY